MPNRDPQVTAGNVRATGKDQGGMVVTYRSTTGKTFLARVLGVATQLAAPTGLTVTPQGTAGTTTYRYRVAPVDAEGGEGVATAGVTTATGAATLNGTDFNRVTWAARAGAVAYKVYGRTGADGAVGLLATVTGTQYDDTGAATPGATVPTFGSDQLRLLISRGPQRIIRNGVRMATGAKQTHVYFNR
jgi:osmotically-inducible protein OsmY